MSKNHLALQRIQIKKNAKLGKIAIAISFIVLLLSYPYVFNRMISVPSEQILTIVALLGMILLNLMAKGNNSLPNVIKVFFLIQSFFWFLFFCYHSDSSYLVRFFFLILTIVITSTLVKTDSLKKFVYINNVVITVQSVLAALGFVFVLTGILSSLGEYTNIDSRSFSWYGITCSNVRLGNIIRVSGFFDEPGALAYWGIYALIFNKLFFENKRVEICLTMSLFFTLSAAYIVQIFAYLLCFNANKKWFVIVLISGLVMALTLNYVEGNEYLRYLTVDRFEGNAIRSSRTELSEMAKGYFLSNPLMGIGARTMENSAYMSDNPYEIPAKDGIIGTLITYLPLLYILFKYITKKKVVFSILILGLGYLQRPFHINEMHYLMMYLFVTMVLLKYNRINSKSNEKNPESINSDSMLQQS